MMQRLLPALLGVWIDHGADEDWGPMCYDGQVYKKRWGAPMNHIVLLGDSIFDNGSYVHQDQGEEPHPQVGEIAGWSWERQQVAVVTMLDDGPQLIIELRPMPENWRRARVVDVATGKEHESVLWYKRWHRVGEKTVDGERAVFEGRCSIMI